MKQVLKKVYDAVIGQLMMRGADHILASCAADATAAVQQFRIPKDKISIMYNGVDLSMFPEYQNNDGHESRNILFVGDLEPWKGIGTLIEAMHHLEAQDRGFTLKLVGDGSLRQKLEAHTDGLDAEFLGQVPHTDMPKHMGSAFAVVLPSLWEGIPTVGLEAMASGTPFIGTNVGGIPEIVQDNFTGLLIPPSHPTRLANAILRLRNNRLRQTLTRNAFQLVKERFAIACIAKQTARLYKAITKRITNR